MSFRRVIVGTAGHIDHGKTSLIKALTGVDCDRLPEEKERGITIDLGFAPLRLPSGALVGVIDVPGHERFVKNMVAGAVGVDFVLLVVAADEGVMPQTVEHLGILDLLGVKDGLVVVTKVDLCPDEDLRALLREEIEALVRGTFLEGAPVVEVSSATGEGLEELLRLMDERIGRVRPKEAEGPFLLAVDRAFLKQGFGVIATGTAYRGQVRVGQRLSVLPQGKSTRVRNLNVHGERVELAMAGQRVALNLSDLSLDEVGRGTWLADEGFYEPTSLFDARLSVLRQPEGLRVRHFERLRLHVGTAEILCRVYLLESEEVSGGERALCQIACEEPVVVEGGSRFILRSYSPSVTLGGGEVIYAYPERAKGRRRAHYSSFLKLYLEASSPEERAVRLLDLMGWADLPGLVRRAQAWSLLGEGGLRLKEAVLSHGGAVLEGELLLSRAFVEEMGGRAREALAQFHRENPHKQGMPQEELISRASPAGLKGYGRAIVQLLWERGFVEVLGGKVALPGFRSSLGEDLSRAVDLVRGHLAARGFAAPTREEIASELSLEAQLLNRALDVMAESGEVAWVGHFVYLTSTLEEAKARLSRAFGERGEITPAVVRDVLGISRKHIIPLLEHLDSLGFTKRVGDKRILRQPR